MAYHKRVLMKNSNWVLVSGPLVTLALSPGWTFDMLNPTKLLALGVVSGFALSQIILMKPIPSQLVKNKGFGFVILFLLSLFIPLIFSGAPFFQQIFGVNGRNLGFLHYFFLSVILLGVSQVGKNVILTRLLGTLVITGTLEACYGWIQYYGADPISWKNPDNWIFGTFGNPNYLSSFLALSVVATLFFAVRNVMIGSKIFFLALAGFQVILLFLSKSTQGLLLILIAIFLISLLFAFEYSLRLGYVASLLGSCLIFISIQGILQIGPLSRFLYQESVTFRGDYWRAGIAMIKDNLYSGVGLDSFGDNYRFYRDSAAANRRGLDSVSNSAHNLLIDLGSTGGIFVLISYLLLIGLAIILVIKKFKRWSNVTLEYKFIVILWLIFNLQTLISINVPSLAVWGWIFMGIIFSSDGELRQNYRRQKIPAKNYIAKTFSTSVALVILLVVPVLPLINREVKMQNAMKSNDIPKIYSVALTAPLDSTLTTNVAIALEKAGITKPALILFNHAVEENPKNSVAWSHIFFSQESTGFEKEIAKNRAEKLDPNLDLNSL